MEILEVRRAPLVPIGSLTTWTRTGWSIFITCSKFRSFCVLGIFSANVVVEVEVHVEHLFEFFRVFDDVGDVDKAVFPFIDIDEGRLDIVEDIGDSAAVDIAGELARFFSLDDQIVQLAMAQDGRSGSLWIQCSVKFHPSLPVLRYHVGAQCCMQNYALFNS